MSKPRHVNNDFSEYMDSTGRVLTLCVLHELDPASTEGLQAVTIIYGFAVCREHLKTVVTAALNGETVDDIIDRISG